MNCEKSAARPAPTPQSSSFATPFCAHFTAGETNVGERPQCTNAPLLAILVVDRRLQIDAQKESVWKAPKIKETNKGSAMKKLILAFLLGTVLMTVVSGCRTAHGFGEDMQNAGDKIQQKTN